MKNSLSIILVNWNQYELTRACILSLLKCNYKNFKIIVVDNNSYDKSIYKLSREFDQVYFIKNNSNLGFTGANNIGINKAKTIGSEYIMLLNNDTEVESNFLEPLIKRLENESDLGIVQPLILNYQNKDIVWNFGGKFLRFFGNPVTLNKNKNICSIVDCKYTEWVSGCCFVFRSSLTDLIGMLDDDYFVYFEDVDYSLKIKKAGYKLGVEINSKIYHHEGESWKIKKSLSGNISPFVHYLRFRNHLYFIKKNYAEFNLFGTILYQFFKLLVFSFYFILRLRFRKLKMVFKGLRDGLKSVKNDI
tara:strand:- start:275 stop:1186 length:912 start_codon:yes stop_codon:yes gene_type:complete